MFDDQVVIVTGAGSGIGAAAAQRFGAQGASVVLNDLDAGRCHAMAERIGGSRTLAVPGDVTDPALPDALVEAALGAFGHVNVLVNNAGYTWDGMLHKMSDAQWQRIQDIHSTAVFRMIRAVAQVWRPLAKQERLGGVPSPNRCVVNVSSTAGLHGGIGQINYATAKMGVIGMTKAVAREWGALGIRCNAVAFGFMDTRLTRPTSEEHTMTVEGSEIRLGIPEAIRTAAFAQIPLGRPGTVEEAATGILMMASPQASYITGHTLEVTGGLGI